MRTFEDMGYFCIDNLPPALVSSMADLVSLPGSKVRKVAIVMDVRGGAFFSQLLEELKELHERGIEEKILFLEASEPVLVKRFKETRRRHPLADSGRIKQAIGAERQLLQTLRGDADLVIDTSNLTAHELRDKIRTSFLAPGEQEGLLITVMSFGYKYGIPLDADLVIDVRFLPNPHYIEKLRRHTGRERVVRDFVLKRDETQGFLRHFFDLLDILIPGYVSEGKSHLAIAIGCTGGTHRSVALAEETGAFLKEHGHEVVVQHRDMGKDFEAK
ncbi:MAG: RNase adapter RapZ [Actinobacteria bacterium]|nr:MAG: RNase adapter RapZ [Actinomycetota bacterium]